ncbi:unnamed protein product [Pleuronectes platessa]|uniref:Uncharacterized protein n=1 Tax=Pleuronectes platessa TaxID=8262 RepID=A0A9N7U635_PLEPL|nr:unnamed protein product [Pleuronectes platessa]
MTDTDENPPEACELEIDQSAGGLNITPPLPPSNNDWHLAPKDGEGHISSSSSPWVVWLSAYLHLSAGASFSLHPSPSSLSRCWPAADVEEGKPLEQRVTLRLTHWASTRNLSGFTPGGAVAQQPPGQENKDC